MSTAVAVPDPKTLFAIVDDLTAFTETLQSVEAAIECCADPEERRELECSRKTLTLALEGICKDLAGKTDAVSAVLRRMDAERDMIQAERDRLKMKLAACDRADEWLRSYVLSVMKQSGLSKLKTATNTIYIRASDAVEITDAAAVPTTYQNAEVKLPLWLWQYTVEGVEEGTELRRDLDAVRVKAEPSLSTIKKALKQGREVAGADLRFRDNLVVR